MKKSSRDFNGSSQIDPLRGDAYIHDPLSLLRVLGRHCGQSTNERFFGSGGPEEMVEFPDNVTEDQDYALVALES